MAEYGRTAVWIIFLTLLFMDCGSVYGKVIRIQGHVKCMKLGDPAPSPADNILVVPARLPPRATLSNSIGFYYFYLPGKLINYDLKIACLDASDVVIGHSEIELFRSRIKRLGRENVYYVEYIELEKPCSEIVATKADMQRQLTFFKKKPEEAKKMLKEVKEVIVLGSTSFSLFSLFGYLPALGASGSMDIEDPDPVTMPVKNISDSHFKSGCLSAYAESAFSGNLGFNLAPSLNLSSAVFSNVSAIAASYFTQITAAVNPNESFLFGSIAVPIGDRFGLGIGSQTYSQSEERSGQLETGEVIVYEFDLYEENFFFGAAASVMERKDSTVYIGITGKLLKQRFKVPKDTAEMDLSDGWDSLEWKYEEKEKSIFDIDLSATVELWGNLMIGCNLASLAGGKLADKAEGDVAQRRIGLGATYQWKKLQIGTDMIWREEQGPSAAVGLNVIPFNGALMNVGYDTTYHTFTTRVNINWLFYSYGKNNLFGTFYTIGVSIKL